MHSILSFDSPRTVRVSLAACILGGALLAAALVPSPLLAQRADVIRGRITGPDNEPLPGANVRATSIPGNVARTARTANDGRFTITFPNGDGDYWIDISAVGFTPRRFELKRLAEEEVLIADTKLTRLVLVLDAVQVQAERARPARNDNAGDVSGTDKAVANGAVDPSQAGNVAAMAASVPGVQLIPGANGNPDQFSVFGLGGDQNASTLNGLGYGGGEIPRDAATRTTLGTSPWDVSRGGFSGAQFGLRTQPGTNFSSRGMSSLVNAPALEWTDRAGRSTGAQYASTSLGGVAAGPLAADQSFYNAAWQFDRRVSDLLNLQGADRYALQLAGVAPDSVVRLRQILAGAGVPATLAGLPGARTTDRGSFLAAFDLAPPASTSGQALNITASGAFTRASSVLGRVTALPTDDVGGTSWFGAVQGRHTSYFGMGVLTETSLGVSRMRNYTRPWAALPNAVVRVNSMLDDGTPGISQLSFGGSPVQDQDMRATRIEAQNQLSWFSANNRHRIKLGSELRYERFGQDFTSNALGTFTYNSLADLEAGTPAAFTRVLSSRLRGAGQVVGALSIGDSYRPTTDLQVQYGVRVDANRFLDAPAPNQRVAEAFGVRNDLVPNRVYVSPRVGFSWTYGAAPQIAMARGFVRGPRAVVRGGIGVFQNTPMVQLLGMALTNTGLPNAVQQVACVGQAVPGADWRTFLANRSSIPTSCADGSQASGFATSAPPVGLLDPDYSAQRSLRTNANWTGALLGGRLVGLVDATWSLNLDQPGFTDLNFNPAARFTLDGEGSRPVFVPEGSIVGATGAIAVQDGRKVPDLGATLMQRSDLRSVSRQLTLSLQPATFNTRYSWALTWVLSSTRDIGAGFANTAGDPRVQSWGRSSMDSRHQLLYSLSYNFFDWLPVGLQGSFRSGRPYTPMVAGDVNGDGFANDRAYVFDPAAAGLDPTLAAEMQQLVRTGSAGARACLTSQLGSVAGRNSCQAPWLATSSLTVALNPVKFRLPQRLNVSFFLNNLPGALDLALNGEDRRKGWGQAVIPDQSLLYVRGFDAATRRFRYEVNPRFGATRPGQVVNRNPVVLTAQVRLDVGFTRERQLLTQSLDRGRVRTGSRASDLDIRAMGGSLVPANPMSLILQQADSLGLTRLQADSVATLNRAYALAFDSVWTPVARYLAALPPGYDRADAYERYRRAREVSVDALIRLAPSVRALLTPAQLRRLPPFILSSLDTRYLASVRSSTAGGANMGALALLAQLGWNGGMVDASGGTQPIMIHR